MARKRSAARGAKISAPKKTKRRVGVRTHGGDGALHVSMDTMRGASAKAAEGTHGDHAAQQSVSATASAASRSVARGILADARELISMARRGGRKLLNTGIDWHVLAELPRRIELVDKAQQAWQRQRVRTAPSTLHRTRDEAAQLKTELLAAGRYVLRHDASAQSRLDVIAAGEGIDDLVNDLRALADFWSRRKSQLERADLGADVLERARTLASQLDLAQHSAEETKGSAPSGRPAKRRLARIGAAVDGVRSVIRDAPERLEVFRAEYQHAKPATERARKRR